MTTYTPSNEALIGALLADTFGPDPLQKYMDLAQRGRTTLAAALASYTGVETLLRKDVFAGVDQILRNLGVNPMKFAEAYLSRAHHQLRDFPGMAGSQSAAVDPGAIVKEAGEKVRAEHAVREAQTEVQRFAADPKNRFYACVKSKMARLIQNDFAKTLQGAYDMACRMDVDIARLINPPDPSPSAYQPAADKEALIKQDMVRAKSDYGSDNLKEIIERFSAEREKPLDVATKAAMARLIQGGFAHTVSEARNIACHLQGSTLALICEGFAASDRSA